MGRVRVRVGFDRSLKSFRNWQSHLALSSIGKRQHSRGRAAQCDYCRPRGYEQAAYDGGWGEFFSEQEPGEDKDKRDAEFIQRGHARGGTQLEGAEIT